MNLHNATPAPSFDEPTTSMTVPVPLIDREEIIELSEDISLPDYQPEIKRLLRINTSVLPPTRYATADGVEVAGNLDYFVLYVGNDDGLYCAPLSAEYRAAIPWSKDLPSAVYNQSPGAATVLCDTTAEGVSGRVTAPRRLNIKTRLRSRIKAYGDVIPDGAVPDNEPLERLTQRVTASRPSVALSELISLQDDVILPPSEHGEMRVVCAEGQVMITEATPSLNAINCRGEVTVKLILCPAEADDSDGNGTATPAAPPTVMLRKIPFTHEVELAEASPSHTAYAHGRCAELSVEMEDGHLHLELGVILEATAERNLTVAYTRDLFSTRREITCRYAQLPTARSIRCLNGNFTLSDSLSLAEVGIDPAAAVVDVTAVPEAEGVTMDDRRCVLNGTCRCHLLLFKDGEYTAAELTLPFRYEMDVRSTEPLPPDILPLFNGHLSAPLCRARMDGERIGIDAELAVALRLAAHCPVTTLAEASTGEEVTRRSGEYVICFPTPTDTLWSVAKRYHAPLAPLAAANGLTTTDSLDSVDYLIV